MHPESVNRKHFFVVGAQRSGTTYLYRFLDAHPQIDMSRPARPEPKFFMIDSLYEKGLAYYYSEFFAHRRERTVLGEKSTSYIESQKAAQRIAHHFPTGKIVIVLRNPVERAISNYWFSVNNGLETLPLEEAIHNESARRDEYDPARVSVSPFAYLQRGLYLNYLQMYETYFPRENIHVLIYEQMVSDPASLRDLLAFLTVATDHTPPDSDERVNASEKAPVDISDDLRAYMYNYFQRPNQLLAARLNVDLSRWWSG